MKDTKNTLARVKLPNLKRSRTASKLAGEGKKLSKEGLATKSGVTSYVVYVAEAGKAILLTEGEKIAKALGVKIESLRN